MINHHFTLVLKIGQRLFYIIHGFHIDWKTWKMAVYFSVREKSENFENTGKVKEVYSKYWKSEGMLPQKLEK